jgi:hypothetical protein
VSQEIAKPITRQEGTVAGPSSSISWTEACKLMTEPGKVPSFTSQMYVCNHSAACDFMAGCNNVDCLERPVAIVVMASKNEEEHPERWEFLAALL